MAQWQSIRLRIGGLRVQVPLWSIFREEFFFIMVKIKCNYYADVLTPQIERHLDDLKISIGGDFFQSKTDDLKILKRLGRGKFSQVFLAKDEKGDQVVLKTIPNCPESFVEKEAQILQYLGSHRGIQEFIRVVKNPMKSVYTLVLKSYPESPLEEVISGFT